jgi:hypothetical protein
MRVEWPTARNNTDRVVPSLAERRFISPERFIGPLSTKWFIITLHETRISDLVVVLSLAEQLSRLDFCGFR